MRVYTEKIRKQINKIPIDVAVPFGEVKTSGISTDTCRKILHRFHERGIITITGRGEFKRIEPFREKLFVYGSLKNGFDNHHLLDRYAKKIGKAITAGKFGMFEDAFGNYPYLIPVPLMRIHGELYEIYRRELLEELDDFEGCPDYYERNRILVKTHRGTVRAYVYMRPSARIPEGQKPLREWKESADKKVERLEEYFRDLVNT